MAAWLVVTGLVGVMMGCAATWARMDYKGHRDKEIERRIKALVLPPPEGNQAILDRVLDRLLEAVVPAQKETDGQPDTYSPAEYDAPVEDVQDWTDPFIGLERPTVARLAPGQGIPGMNGDAPVDPVDVWRREGEGAFDDWLAESLVPDDDGPNRAREAESWVDPVRLDDE